MTLLIGIATAISIWTQDDFQTCFSDILSVMIYLLVPWSAINLADYYLVGIACQVPFMKMSFYTGAIAKALGADFAWLPGLLIPATGYVVRERKLLLANPTFV